MGYNCRWQCTESSFPNFNVLEGPEPSIWDVDCKDAEPTGQKITRIIPLPRVIVNQCLRSEERHIEDEINSQTELKDKSMADPQPPMSRDSPISSDKAIQAAKSNSRSPKTSQESPSQAPEWTEIGNNVNNSLFNLEDSSKFTYTPINSQNLIVAGIKILGSDRTQIGSDFAITELSDQTTRSDQFKCSEVQGSASTSIMNTSASVPVPSADPLLSYSSSQPTALVETESILSNVQSPQNPIARTENTSERDPSVKDGVTPVEEKRPPHYMSGIAGQAVGLSCPLSSARPTEFVSSGKQFSSYPGSAKLKSIRPASPLIKTARRAPKLLSRMHLKHPAYNPPLTPPPDSPIPPPTPPSEHQQGRIVDRISERLHRPHGSSPNSPPSR
ncbi:hypothetical protein BPAE_0269g00140 [Botrytis paeoniae]|uniref:Uncharacterized protein n=1 Tax=Botrytis paeoniae TaxID=278948 RepID=A0A4Z1F7H4_9HELO|nr:hypothetical protein BPAE_0269g00140 [Botrytis paeoniae]